MVIRIKRVNANGWKWDNLAHTLLETCLNPAAQEPGQNYQAKPGSQCNWTWTEYNVQLPGSGMVWLPLRKKTWGGPWGCSLHPQRQDGNRGELNVTQVLQLPPRFPFISSCSFPVSEINTQTSAYASWRFLYWAILVLGLSSKKNIMYITQYQALRLLYF